MATNTINPSTGTKAYQVPGAAPAPGFIASPSTTSPSQVANAVTNSINPHDAVGYNPATDPTSTANPSSPNYNPGSTITTPPANPTTPPAVSTAQPSPTTVNATAATQATSPTVSTPSGLPGAAPLTGTGADQAGQAVDELKQKYGQALTDLTGSGVDSPSSPGSGHAGVTAALGSQPPPQTPQPTTTPAVDAFFNPETNPALQQSTEQLMQFLSPQETRSDVNLALGSLQTDQAALGQDKLALMNIKNVMAGTSDDIRNEVTAANGFATESQVQALAVARNQSLLKQATLLQDQVTTTQDMVANDTSLLTNEKEMANTQFTQRMGILNYQQTNQKDMLNAARTSLGEMQKTEGWDGVYKAAIASGDPTAISRINSTMGPGFDLATAAKNDTTTAMNKADLAAKQASTVNTQVNTQKTLQDLNDAQGLPNPAKAGQSGYTDTGIKYTPAVGAQEINSLIQQQGLTGTRGLLAPADYNRLKSAWVQNGLKDSDFDSIYGGMKDPKLASNHVYN